jgi:hypothetical protein
VTCGLTIRGIGISRLSRTSAAGHNSVIIPVQGGPGALAITLDGEIWAADSPSPSTHSASRCSPSQAAIRDRT